MKMLINIPSNWNKQISEMEDSEVAAMLYNIIKNGFSLDSMTNGEVTTTIFPDARFKEDVSKMSHNSGWLTFKGNPASMQIDLEWWNTPYKGDK